MPITMIANANKIIHLFRHKICLMPVHVVKTIFIVKVSVYYLTYSYWLHVGNHCIQLDDIFVFFLTMFYLKGSDNQTDLVCTVCQAFIKTHVKDSDIVHHCT